MSKTTDDPLEDTGLDWPDVALTGATVYARLAGLDAADGDPQAWVAVARAAAAMFGYDENAHDGDVRVPVDQLASQLRRAYARAAGTDGDVCEWADLGPKFRIAWEGATRHLSNVFGMDRVEAGRLGSHEDRMVAFMHKRAAKAAAI